MSYPSLLMLFCQYGNPGHVSIRVFQESVCNPVGKAVDEPDLFQAFVFKKRIDQGGLPEGHSGKGTVFETALLHSAFENKINDCGVLK